MRNFGAIALLVMVSACAAPDPGARAGAAKNFYGACLRHELDGLVRSSMTAEAAADQATKACAAERATLGAEVAAANHVGGFDYQTEDALADYDIRVRAKMIEYINEKRKL